MNDAEDLPLLTELIKLRERTSTNHYKTKQEEQSFKNELQTVMRFQGQKEGIRQGTREFTGKVTSETALQ